MALPYLLQRQNEILEYFYGFGSSYGDLSFDELPLDDVIMTPDMLIRITDFGDEKIDAIVCNCEEAKVFCDSITEGVENGGIEIANTIISQLGGSKFTAMTGSRNFVAIKKDVFLENRYIIAKYGGFMVICNPSASRGLYLASGQKDFCIPVYFKKLLRCILGLLWLYLLVAHH